MKSLRSALRIKHEEPFIDPASIAFDFDGVFADTMTLFLDIIRTDHGIDGIELSDITCYHLDECLDLDPDVIDDAIEKLLEGDYNHPLKPYTGVRDVVSRLAQNVESVLIVTARSILGPLRGWFPEVLSIDSESVEIVATGAFEAKADVLLNKNISYFVEDRLETCFLLQEVGINPILFRQPWNRRPHPFIEVGNWRELETLIRLG